jgi:transcriptional regulator with XRE-family HTH domain
MDPGQIRQGEYAERDRQPVMRKPNGSGSSRMAKARDPQEILLLTNLVRFRKEAGLSQEQASVASGVPIDNLRRYENQVNVPNPIALKALCEVYGHTVDDAYLEDPPPARESLRPTFLLKLMPGVEDVDPELLREAQAVVAKLNEKQREIRAKKTKKR